MIWIALLVGVGLFLYLALTYLVDRATKQDLPPGWPPAGDHTAEWINEDHGSNPYPRSRGRK